VRDHALAVQGAWSGLYEVIKVEVMRARCTPENISTPCIELIRASATISILWIINIVATIPASIPFKILRATSPVSTIPHCTCAGIPVIALWHNVSRTPLLMVRCRVPTAIMNVLSSTGHSLKLDSVAEFGVLVMFQ